MATEVELPDGTILEIPDGADPSAVAKAYLSKQQQPRPSLGQSVARNAGLGARSIYNSLASMPNMVHDIPAALSNMATRTFYPEGYDVTINGKKEHRSGLLPTAGAQQNEAMTSMGLPSPQTTPEKISDFATQMITGLATSGPINKAVSSIAGLKPVPQPYARPTPSQEVLTQAQREGMVVPPAQVAPRSAGAFFEGMGGTLKTGQQAAARNQPIIDEMAARAVGVSDEALSPELLQAIRAEAGNAHRVIRAVGEVITDDDFIKQIDNAARPFRSTQSAFPQLAKANQAVIDIADDVAKKTFDADAAVDAIQMLRENASVAYRAGANNQGAAYKSMANALEGAIERHLERQGGDARGVLDAFRQARQLIAKTYTVEDALKGSHVDINALGRMLKNGVPLTEELDFLGRFAQQFPGAANLTSALKARPAYSPLDAVTAASSLGAAAATGNAAVAAPAAYAAARPAARWLALSPAIQRQMVSPPLAQKLSQALPYATGATPTFSQLLADALAKKQQERR